MLTTDQRGAYAEFAISHAAIKLGIDVYRPITERGRYDLIFDLGSGLLRVQCKHATCYKNAVVVRCYSCRQTTSGQLRRSYTADEIDALAAYSSELDRCFLLPAARIEGRRAVWLRLTPTRNNQKSGINWADDFDFAATLSRLQGP
jgi:PD-(D/E)XK endonuclease